MSGPQRVARPPGKQKYTNNYCLNLFGTKSGINFTVWFFHFGVKFIIVKNAPIYQPKMLWSSAKLSRFVLWL